MKKRALMAVFLCAAIFFAQTVSAEMSIRVIVAGETVRTEVAPIIVNNRTLVPLRAIFEAIKAKVKWNSETRTVTITKDGKTLELTVNSDIMLADGKEVKLEVPATIINNRTMVPLRACSEAFDLKVFWDEESRTVRVKQGMWLLSEKTDSKGNTETYEYNENGQITRDDKFVYEYDKYGNLLRSLVIPEMFYEVSYGYDKYGNKTYEQSIWHTWKHIEYDDNRRMICKKSYGAIGLGSIENYTYEQKGQNSLVVKNIFIRQPSEGNLEEFDEEWEKWEYDSRGNELYYENSGGIVRKSKYEYDQDGNLIYHEDPDGKWEKYEYDSNGNKIYYEDSGGQWEKWGYDEEGKIINNETSDGNFYTMSYQYDKYRNVTYKEVFNNGYWTGLYYEYDEYGNLIYEQGNGYWVKYEYDKYGNLIYEQDISGNWVKYSYVYLYK